MFWLPEPPIIRSRDNRSTHATGVVLADRAYADTVAVPLGHARMRYEGSSIAKKTVDEPLTIHPLGGEGACTYTVIRDALEQSYHQVAYAWDTYP